MSSELATREAPQELQPLVAQLEQMRPHVRQVGVDEQRFIRIVLNELQRNPELGKCEPQSFFFAVLRAAEKRLEPSGGLSWLIPRKGQVTWQIGYKGVIELAARSGIIITTNAVYEGDHFVEHGGTDARIEHSPTLNHTGEPIAWYAVAQLPDGRTLHRVLSRAEVEKRRKAGKTKFEPGRPWHDWYDSMARKTAVLALISIVPLSGELRDALAADDHVQTIGLGGLEPVAEDHALTAAGEVVDTTSGEIKTSSPPRDEGPAAAQPAAGPEYSAPEGGQPVESGTVTPGSAAAATSEPEQPPEDDHLVAAEADDTHVDSPAAARPATPDQRDMIRAIAAERIWTEDQACGFLGIESFDDPALDFDVAADAIGHWLRNLEAWRNNRRERLARSSRDRGVDLPKLLAERKLPFAGELNARQAQELIDEIEQLPANQPSTGEAASAPAADSSVEQDPSVRAQFDATMQVSFAGPSARARWRDKFLLQCGVDSIDALTDDQLRAGMAKAKKDTQ